MDFVQDDLSLMQAEHQKWVEQVKMLTKAQQQAQQKTDEALQPLRNELAELDDQVRSEERKHTGKVSGHHYLRCTCGLHYCHLLAATDRTLLTFMSTFSLF